MVLQHIRHPYHVQISQKTQGIKHSSNLYTRTGSISAKHLKQDTGHIPGTNDGATKFHQWSFGLSIESPATVFYQVKRSWVPHGCLTRVNLAVPSLWPCNHGKDTSNMTAIKSCDITRNSESVYTRCHTSCRQNGRVTRPTAACRVTSANDECSWWKQNESKAVKR
jgi:hypothetical protein